jgi:hypothetical protein
MATNITYSPYDLEEVDNAMARTYQTVIPKEFRQPALDTLVRNKYLFEESMRMFLTPYDIPGGNNAMTKLKWKSYSGDVRDVHEVGMLPLIDEEYETVTYNFHRYGGKVRVTWDEMRLNEFRTVESKLETLVNRMNTKESTMILAAIDANVSSGGTYPNDVTITTGWSDNVDGDPSYDISMAKDTIRLATHGDFNADTLIMNTNTMQNLYKFDEIRNALYTAGNQFITSGNIPSIAGMQIRLFESVPNKTFYVFKSGAAGQWAMAHPLATDYIKIDSRIWEHHTWNTAGPAILMPQVLYKAHWA